MSRRRASSIAILAVVLAAGTVGWSGTSAGATSASSTNAPPPRVPLLGVLDAGSGRYDADTLTLTLRGVQPNGAWFTDRPIRAAGSMDVEALLDVFFRGDDPPNAALVIDGADPSRDVAVLELADPTYDAEKRRVRMTATPVVVDAGRVARHPGLAAYYSRNDDALPKRFSAAALFLDAAEVASSPGGSAAPVGQGQITEQDVDDLSYRLRVDLVSVQESIIELERLNERYNPPNPCVAQLLGPAKSLMNDLMTVSKPAISALETEVTDNNGVLPADDVAAYDSANSDLATQDAATTQLASQVATCQSDSENPGGPS